MHKSWKSLSFASALIASLGVACAVAPTAGNEPTGSTSQAMASTAICPVPYKLACDAAGANCKCETDPQLSPALPAKDIAAAAQSTYLIKTDGTVWGWGASNANAGFPLGPTVPGTQDTPFADPVTAPVSLGVANAVQLAAGPLGACALLASGTVSCWGTLTPADGAMIPSLVQNATGASLVGAVSVSHGNAHACALLQNASVVCWGDNRFGQLADGTSDPHVTSMTAAPAVDSTAAAGTAVQVLAAGDTTCILYASGHVSCYGSNVKGQLGLGSHGDLAQTAPVPPQSIGKIDAMYGGGLGTICMHQPASIGIDAGGVDQMQCWGDDENTELDGVTPAHDAFSPHPSTVAGLTARAFGTNDGCGWQIDGTPSCWGSNLYGALGASAGSAPRPIVDAGNVVQMAIGDTHMCAINHTSVVCWGDNSSGQLGIGSTLPVIPIQSVPGIPKVVCASGSVTCDRAGTSNDGCHCPVCVPVDPCQDNACGLLSNGCGVRVSCGKCGPPTCPKGTHWCGPDEGCVRLCT